MVGTRHLCSAYEVGRNEEVFVGSSFAALEYFQVTDATGFFHDRVNVENRLYDFLFGIGHRRRNVDDASRYDALSNFSTSMCW